MIQVRGPDGTLDSFTWAEFEDAVREGRVPADASVCLPAVTGAAFVLARDLEAYQSIVDAPRTRFERSFEVTRTPAVVLTTSLLIFGVFLWQLQDAGPGGSLRWAAPLGGIDGATLLRQGAKSLPHQVELGEWWRLLTASALHVGWWHLVPNLVYLVYVGWSVEAVLGRGGTALLLVATGIGSMGMSSLATPQPSVGASGLAFGMFGAAVALGWRVGPWLPAATRERFGWRVFPFVVWFLLLGVLNSRAIDHFCHLGGLAVGVALGLTLPAVPAQRVDRVGRGALRLAAAIGLAGLFGVVLPLASAAGHLPGGGLSTPEIHSELGLALRVPSAWEPGTGEVDEGYWRSPTGAARLSVGGWVAAWRPPTEAAVRARWKSEQLASYGAVEVPPGASSPGSIDLGPGWFVQESNVVAGGRVLRALRAGRIRGCRVVTIEFLHPLDRFEQYRRLRSRVWASVDERAPAALDRAAPAASSSPSARTGWALETAFTGDRAGAEQILAGDDSPSGVSSGAAYVRLWIDRHLGDSEVPTLAPRARAMAFSPAPPFDVLPSASARELVLAHDVLAETDPGAAAAIESELTRRDPSLVNALLPTPPATGQ